MEKEFFQAYSFDFQDVIRRMAFNFADLSKHISPKSTKKDFLHQDISFLLPSTSLSHKLTSPQEAALNAALQAMGAGCASLLAPISKKASLKEKLYSFILYDLDPFSPQHFFDYATLETIANKLNPYLKHVDNLHALFLDKIKEFAATFSADEIALYKIEWITFFREVSFNAGLIFWRVSMLLKDIKACKTLDWPRTEDPLLPENPIVAFMLLHDLEEFIPSAALATEPESKALAVTEKSAVPPKSFVKTELEKKEKSPGAANSHSSYSRSNSSSSSASSSSSNSSSPTARATPVIFKRSHTFSLSPDAKPRLVRRLLEKLGLKCSPGAHHDKIETPEGKVITLLSRGCKSYAPGTKKAIENAVTSFLKGSPSISHQSR